MAITPEVNPSSFDPTGTKTAYLANIAAANANATELYGKYAGSSQTPGSTSNGAMWTSAGITVTGASVGDPVIVGVPSGFQDGLFAFGKVTAADTVKICIGNLSGGSLTPQSGTYKMQVHKRS